MSAVMWAEVVDYIPAPPTPPSCVSTDDSEDEKNKPFSRRPNPLESASLPSIAMAHWIQPMVSLGAQRVLELRDMWPIGPSDSCDALEARFRRGYDPKPQVLGISPVAMAYAKTFQKELVLVLFGSVLYVVALAMQSYVAQALLQFLNDRENIFGIANGYWLVVLMTASSIVAVCTLNFVFFTTSRIGANVRSLTMTLVFDKALRLSSAARQEYTAGEVLTLMSVDAERVFTAVLQSPWHVMGPLAFVVSVVMIGVLLDAYSALAGAAVLVVVMWVTVKQGDRIAHLQRRLLEVIEKRVKVTSEALQGIRVMKFYAWEEPLAQRVEKLRAREVGLLRKFHSFQVINTVMLFLTPTFLSGVTLGLYVLLHSTIDIIEAFTLIAMVNICRTALFQLPQAVSSFCKARISLSRVDAFLASDEFVTNHLSDSTPSNAMAASPTTQPLISKDYTEDTGSIGRGKISFRDASFRWPVSAQINDLVVVTTAVIENLVVMMNDGVIAAHGSYREVLEQFPSLTPNSNVDDTDIAGDTDADLVEENADEVKVVPVNTHEMPREENVAEEEGPTGQLIREEDRVRGSVGGHVYKTYFDESGFNGVLVALVLGVAYGVSQAARTVVDWWPGHWARNMARFDVDPSYSGTTFGMWYLGLIVLCSALTMTRALTLIASCMRTSQNLHDQLFRRVLAAPVTRYFDVTPVGRILNRFSNDLDQMDAVLPEEYQLLFQNVSMAVGTLVVSAFASYWIAVLYIPLIVIFEFMGDHFKKSSCELKRLEGITRTPVYNLFNETLSGLATIRAFRMERAFSARNREVVDRNGSVYLSYWGAGRWLASRLDLLSVVIIFAVTTYLVSAKGNVGALTSGLSLTYSLMLTSMVQWVMRSVDRTDNAMTSVERLLFFRQIESEDFSGTSVAELLDAENRTTGVKAQSWPSRGTIRFDQLCLRYRPELPLVLKGVDMDVAAGEKVGICGRTGAGKSSLMVALFRICDFDSGRVLIDDVDISSISVRELRRSLAIIPQDPVLFSGPLRENLDPFHEYSDERLWAVLKQVHMADKLRRWGSGLDFEVAESGDNLSVGQRQLLCIGRALLKDSQVVVLDEATANVDTATDALIQTTIQETFAAKTVLIIAHRINTILHCDKIAVLDAGRVAEFGCPSDLLAQPQSVFATLAKRGGRS
ncbi:hypothetical protein PRNP1_014193 [Phytophthora ramorum]